MIILGVTGSLASGKSCVAGLFKNMGARVFDADEIAKRQVRKGTPVYKAIVKLFGKQFLKTNGQIDRKKLASWVFRHPRDLKKLNILIHPGVIFECIRVIKNLKSQKGVLVLDVPLLFESRMEGLADWTVTVSSARKNCIRRAKKKGIPQDLAQKILSTQWPMERKERSADFVITNKGTLKDLDKQVRDVFLQITTNERK